MSIAKQIDKICDEFEAAFRAGKPQKLRDVLENSPQKLRAELLLRLIEVEVELRLADGQAVKTADYAEFEDTAVRHAAEVMSQHAETITTIGPYKLGEQLGEGGMGVVFMAEQKEPLRRQVALKLIRVGMDGPEVLARFEQEREALSLMDHENIAKVLDAGTTENGRPYFVMELVKGIPLTKYCDSHRLSIDERLRLFLQTCSAIHHAHQKSVIHRDIKPSNVLVTLHDGKPLVKVIDFGLAKAIQGRRLGDRSLKTEFKQVMGTLQYMSPEQAEMNALDVDTRSDVYSLGILLYELLTGSTPIQKESAERMALDRVLLAIREDEAPRPSLRLHLLGESATSISDLRRMDSVRLSLILKGELDWIVMKALEKDRTRRYDSASAFAKDVGNFLCGDVVTARPPSLKYQLQKYVRKHRLSVTLAVSLLLALLLGIIGTSWGMYRASVEAGIARTAEGKAEEKAETARKAEEKAKNEADLARKSRELAEAEGEATRRALDKQEATLARSNYFLAHARWNENRVSEARELLQRIPAKHRNLEWHLDWRLFEGCGVTLRGHTEAVTCVAFSPDGTRVVSGSRDKSLKLWDTATGQNIRTLTGHTNSVWSAAFSPDSSRIVSASTDNTVKLWSTTTGQELQTCKGKIANVGLVAFNDSGERALAVSDDYITSMGDDSEVELNEGIRSVAISRDGTQIVSKGHKWKVGEWDAATGDEVHQPFSVSHFFLDDRHPHLRVSSSPADHRNAVRRIDTLLDGSDLETSRVVFSPDGTLIAAGCVGGIVKLWDAATGQQFRTLAGHADVTSVAFNSDGTQIISGSGQHTLKLWNVATGDELRTLRGHSGRVWSVAFSDNGSLIVSGSDDHTLKLWNAATYDEPQTFNVDVRGIFAPAFSFNADCSQFVASSLRGTLKLWDVGTGAELQTLDADWATHDVAFSSDGTRIISGRGDHTLKLWDTATGEELRTLKGHSSSVESVAFSRDGRRVLSGSHDGTLKLWDAETGEELRTLNGHNESIKCVAISPDGTRIVSGSWDGLALAKGSELMRPDGALKIRNGTLKLWDASTGAELQTLSEDTAACDVAFSSDGSLIVSGHDDSILILWDAATGEELRTLKGHSSSVASVAFSRDGRRVLSGSFDGTLKLWDVETGEELRTLKGRTHPIIHVAISGDSKKVYSVSNEGTLELWGAATGTELRRLKEQP